MQKNEKTSWLFLRGLIRGTGHWADFTEHFRRHFPNEAKDQMIFIDLAGNGEDFQATSPWNLSEYLHHVRDNTLEQRKNLRLKVVSMSMGAMLTVEWMRQYPGEIEQAFLINTSAANFSLPLQRFQIQNFWPLLLEKVQHPLEKKIISISYNSQSRLEQFSKQLSDYSNSHPVSPSNALRQITAAAKYSFPRKSPGNVVLMACEKDRLVQTQCSKIIAEAWKAPLELHPWAGHDLPFDDPQWVLEKIKLRSN
jgi:pimeloyl-ACP methyl ester carboxylesterase